MTESEQNNAARDAEQVWGGGYKTSQITNFFNCNAGVNNSMVLEAFVEDFFEGSDWSDIKNTTADSITEWTQWEDRADWIYWHWFEGEDDKVLKALVDHLEYLKD